MYTPNFKTPRIKKGMRTFVGCYIGEKRLGLLSSLITSKEGVNLMKLVKTGYLTSEVSGNRMWFALTQRGKDHVSVAEV